MHIVIHCHGHQAFANQDGWEASEDGWEAFDDIEDATARYRELLQDDNLISASICQPIVSTDYT